MNSIKILLLPPTEAGRLYPRYVKGAKILAVKSRVARPWPFGVNIDGGLILDLDERRVLANFELFICKSKWKGWLAEEVPAIATPGDLFFTSETVQTKNFDLPLQVRRDNTARRISIRFSELRPDRAVSLSKTCIALLREDELLGFDVRKTAPRSHR